jgi:drug/metabolite transporter (DMT)-like permease
VKFELGLLGLLAGLWGSSYLFAKVALATIPPLTLVALRVTIAAAFLLLVLRAQGVRMPQDGKSWLLLLIQALLNSIAPWTVLAWGQQFVDSGLAGVLNSTSPIFVIFITLIFIRHQPVSGWQLLGAGLGLLGVVLTVGVDVLRGLGQEAVAQLAVLLGALLYAGAALHGKRLSHLSPAATAAGTMILASLCLVPASLVVDRPWTLNPSQSSLLAAIVLAVFCTAGALVLYFRLLRTLGPMGVTSQAYLRAGVSVVLGIVVLGERVTPAIGLGLAAIILGVAAINLRKR